MSKMQLKVYGSDERELISVPFDKDHVTWAIRQLPFFGRVTEERVAAYLANLVAAVGADWERQKSLWLKAKVGEHYSPGSLDVEKVERDLAAWTSPEPFPGYDDDGNRIPVASHEDTFDARNN